MNGQAGQPFPFFAKPGPSQGAIGDGEAVASPGVNGGSAGAAADDGALKGHDGGAWE